MDYEWETLIPTETMTIRNILTEQHLRSICLVVHHQRGTEALNKFLDELLHRVCGSQIAIKVATAQLRPHLTPVLAELGLRFEEIQPALELLGSCEQVRAAVRDPRGFLKRFVLDSSVEDVARQVAHPSILTAAGSTGVVTRFGSKSRSTQ